VWEVSKVLPMRPEVLKGHLDALLLAVLETGPQHGYAVIEALRTSSDGALDLPTGTVYPALHRLERAGLIASDWEIVGGRRRRAYHLTPSGHAALGEQRAVWDQFSTAVTAVLGRGPWPATV
jgi:PadR family transcriptional regulator PadR